MNMDRLVVGESHCIICDIIYYLIAQKLQNSEIYWKLVKTFGENVITEKEVFHQMFRLFSNRFCFHLCPECLNKV